MESRIGWLGAQRKGAIDVSLISVDTYTGEEVQLTPEQLAIVRARELEEESMNSLMAWLGAETVEEAEAFLADLEAQYEF